MNVAGDQGGALGGEMFQTRYHLGITDVVGGGRRARVLGVVVEYANRGGARCEVHSRARKVVGLVPLHVVQVEAAGRGTERLLDDVVCEVHAFGRCVHLGAVVGQQ
jgi:hypothetical protein